MKNTTLLAVNLGIAVMIVGAVLLGHWLDGIFDTSPWIMLTLIILSIPASLGLKIWMALSMAKQMRQQQQFSWEDEERENESLT